MKPSLEPERVMAELRRRFSNVGVTRYAVSYSPRYLREPLVSGETAAVLQGYDYRFIVELREAYQEVLDGVRVLEGVEITHISATPPVFSLYGNYHPIGG